MNDLIKIKDQDSLVAWYAVFVLLLAYVLSFVDRIILSLLVTPIKDDLGTTDAQMGLLMGFAFAIFYTLAGIPIAKYSDVKSRRSIIAIGIFLWSIMTAVCGLAKSFFQLFLARVGVGVGEAALTPAAYSMISDYFSEEKLGRAMGAYKSGAMVGGGLAFIIGGAVVGYVVNSESIILPILGEMKPWQMAFILVGLPGILIGLLMLTVREPKRTGLEGSLGERVSISDAIKYMRERWKLYLFIFLGFAFTATPITTALTWIPVYLQRIHEMSIADSGKTLGVIIFFLSTGGVLFSGWLIDFLKKKGFKDGYFRVALSICVITLPVAYFVMNDQSLENTLWWLHPFVFLASMPLVITATVLQIVTPNQLRAQVSAVYMLFLNLITALLATTGIGFITDYWFGDEMALGQSITLVNLISMILAFSCLYIAMSNFNKEFTKS